jgi:hypothetical protein
MANSRRGVSPRSPCRLEEPSHAARRRVYYISHLQAGSLYISWVALKDGVHGPSYLPPAKVAVLNKAAIAACDEIDGLKDNLIEDPTRCKFDPASIQCKGAAAPVS